MKTRILIIIGIAVVIVIGLVLTVSSHTDAKPAF